LTFSVISLTKTKSQRLGTEATNRNTPMLLGRMCQDVERINLIAGLGALKTETSPHFRENLDAFSNFVNHLVISGTKPDELQLFRFLMEVRFAVDTIIAIV